MNLQRDESHKKGNEPNFCTQQKTSKLRKAPKLFFRKILQSFFELLKASV